MHNQKKKKTSRKKRKQKSTIKDWYNNAYDPTNPLTIYYAKYINKDKKV